MTLSPLALAILEFFEDYRSNAYADQHGIWTCGFGHTGPDVTQGTTCTLEQAQRWLSADTGHAQAMVTAAVVDALTQHQFDALVLLTYNIGVSAFQNSTLLKDLNGGVTYTLVADQFPIWNKVNGMPNLGLTRRRAVERALFLDKLTA